MTEYAPAAGRDRNTYYSNPHLVSPHYTNGNGVNYFYPQGQLQLPATGTYTACTPMYTSSPQPGPQSPMYMPNHIPAGVPYSLAPPPRQYPAQPRTLSYPPYHTGVVPTQRGMVTHQLRRAYNPDLALAHINEIESQESINEESMLSEPIVPVLEGYPDVAEFDQLVETYVKGLSPKKQDKALISARRARNIRSVLMDKRQTNIESAQFRFWVKKMFSLTKIGNNGPNAICHDMKPVAVREKLFKILTRAHKACHHGGRDKTSAQVRRVYSWVPKELISRFVKMCPTCKIRRPSRDERNSSVADSPPSDEDMPDSPDLRRASIPEPKRESLSIQPPMGFSSTFAQQNRWMADLPGDKGKGKTDYYDTMPPTSYCGPTSPAVMSPQYSRLSEQFNALSFPSANDMVAASGFPSSNVRSTGNWQSVNSAYNSPYPTKQERGGRVKKEHHY